MFTLFLVFLTLTALESFPHENKTGEWKFLLTIIMTIYNTESYLPEAIESVLNQTLGFQRNIQLILVNDGSTDNTESICTLYSSRYPKNIIYIYKENGGPSSGRNAGLLRAEGKYINFLDSDDRWSSDACECMYNFFEKHYQEVDIIAARIQEFEASNKFHVLDYKFSHTRVADLKNEYQCIQLHCASVFVKAQALNGISFEESIISGEDIRLLNTILLRKCKLGLVKEALYFYRKRHSGDSIVQTSKYRPHYYTASVTGCLEYLISLSLKQYGQVLQFIQYTVMYDLQWRLRDPCPSVLTESQRVDYINAITAILSRIDDIIIIKQRNLNLHTKILCLSTKYNMDIRPQMTIQKNGIYFRGILIWNHTSGRRNLLTWQIMRVENDSLILQSQDRFFLPSSMYSYYAIVNNEPVYPIYSVYPKLTIQTLLGSAHMGRLITFVLPLRPKQKTTFSFFLSYAFSSTKEGSINLQLIPRMGKFAILPPTSFSYTIRNNLIIREIAPGIIQSMPYSLISHLYYEKTYCQKLQQLSMTHLIPFRLWYWFCIATSSSSTQIWLLLDRNNSANDNSEHLFRYLMRIHPSKIKPYFCISTVSSDYQRLVSHYKHNVLPLESSSFKIKGLLADKIIDSYANELVPSSFSPNHNYMADIYHYKYIYLQHGIIKDDISEWLNQYKRNFDRFITASYSEHKSLLAPDYGLSNDILDLTGFPRFDHLFALNEHLTLTDRDKTLPTHKIFFMPTWRKSLQIMNPLHNNHASNPSVFLQSQYYKEISQLINDSRLLVSMRKHRYTGLLCLHPLFRTFSSSFIPNDIFQIQNDDPDYQQEFVSSSILITDYSSIAFDFAILKKPVVYFQFDASTFYQQHSYHQGYFNYSRDGFGPVCYDRNEAVTEIVALIENNSHLEEKYLRRIEEFFAYFDQNNSARTYSSIQRLDYPSSSDSYALFRIRSRLFLTLLVIAVLYQSRHLVIYFKRRLRYLNARKLD